MTEDEAISIAARVMQSRRKVRKGGPRKKLSPCPKCGRLFGVREMRGPMGHARACGLPTIEEMRGLIPNFTGGLSLKEFLDS